MTLETNAFTSYSAVGNKEDISDVIYNVDPFETPFLTAIDDVKASNRLHQWQTDVLAAPVATNYQLEGDAEAAEAQTASVLLSNTCQISRKVPRVTGTQQAIDHYGRSDELAYLELKAAKELRNDMETQLLANNAEVTGDATTKRETAGIGAWLETNTDFGAGGSDGTIGNTARTDGTQRAFTESQLKTVLAATWTAGGNPDKIMLGAFNKQVFSTFTGNATRYKTAEDSSLMAAIDIYDSDFGELEVIPSRNMRSRDCLVLQTDLWAVAYLRRPHREELAKTGDSRSVVMRAEYAFVSRNEIGSGGVFDLTTS